MQIGLMLEGQDGLNWDNWKTILDIADNAGYQCVFRSDHFTNASGPVKDALELWTSLSYAASNTKNIEFGSLVTPITFRHPALIAQYAASIDVLSEGRFYLGMGTGWQDREHKTFGIYFPEIKERYERLIDGLEIASKLLNTDEPVTYHGKHYSLEAAQILMKNPKGTKILVGGNGPKKTLPLAAKYAIEWNGVYLNRADFKERCDLLDGYLEAEGRNPEDLKRSLMMRVIYGKDDVRVNEQLAHIKSTKAELIERGIVVGTGSEVLEQLGQWQEAGCERIMLQWLDLGDLAGIELMAKEVLPHFHQ
jgi:alkanesulfonate monooxygenase SsuD/methylene tetrahydromethanopterin reductase-like flavin-dependent oxidoreductase (luciferase family)